MISKREFSSAQQRARDYYQKASIVLTPEESEGIEVVDFGLSDLQHTGLEIVTYINTEAYCAKEMVLFPHQTCAEHRHPSVDGHPGKMETFRCRWGVVYLYIEGEATPNPVCAPPPGTEQYYSVWQEIALQPGEQFTIPRNTLHWFQAGDEGAVISEFSTTSRDEADVFTNPNIGRATLLAAK